MKNQLERFEFQTVALPSFEEVLTNKDWVYWGGDNLWPRHSVDLYNFSSINRACINAKRDGVWGKQLLIDGVDANTYMVNSGESLRTVYKKVAMDFVIHNGFAMNVIKRRDGEGISEFYQMDVSKLRSGKVDFRDFVQKYYYSADWRDTRKYKVLEIPAFNLDNPEPSQIYWYMGYAPNQTYYPMPEWIGGRVAVEIDINIKNFHLQNLQNGFFPSIFISLNNGVPSEEERSQTYRHLMDKYSSTNNAGGLFLNFSDDKEHEPTITTLSPNNSDTFYRDMDDIVRNTILTSHRITSPKLLGIETPGSLGSKDEVVEGYEHFLRTVIVPLQEQLLAEFEKLLFLRDKKLHKLTIVQNEIFDTDKTESLTPIISQ
jgi:hypothetical protein